MTIPKIIHYCWFGGGKLNNRMKKCLESWHRFCPDYEIICWSEENSPLNDNSYVQQAYAAKKWAFVSDYVRTKALATYGGIYLDTDVELLKPLNAFLTSNAFAGFELDQRIATCILGCTPNHPLFVQWMNSYSNRTFLLADGSWDSTTNVITFTNLLESLGLQKNGKYQQLPEIDIYPQDWFCAKNLETGKIILSKNSHAIHHFEASWMPLRNRFHTRLAQVLGPKKTQQIKHILGRA